MKEFVRAGETVDDLRPGVKIIQAREGYRFSLDPVLLSDFARVGEEENVADLGTGAGVIPLLVAARSAAGRIVGIELQPALADRARRSVRLNGLEGRVSILEGDVRGIRQQLAPQSFDVVLANPPYRRPQTGRRAPAAERAAARHELAGGLGDFLRSAFFLLRHGGRMYLIHLAERLPEVLAEMRKERIEPKRLRCIHSRSSEKARLVLVEGRKGGRPGLAIEPPLFIYQEGGYTAEVLAMYGDVKLSDE